MTNANPLALASASDVKALVETGTVTVVDALARVDAVLVRQTLTEGKKRRWARLREWLVKCQTENLERSV